MKKALVLDPEDIKELIAEKFNVPKSNVFKSQYSYTVTLEEESSKGEE